MLMYKRTRGKRQGLLLQLIEWQRYELFLNYCYLWLKYPFFLCTFASVIIDW